MPSGRFRECIISGGAEGLLATTGNGFLRRLIDHEMPNIWTSVVNGNLGQCCGGTTYSSEATLAMSGGTELGCLQQQVTMITTDTIRRMKSPDAYQSYFESTCYLMVRIATP